MIDYWSIPHQISLKKLHWPNTTLREVPTHPISLKYPIQVKGNLVVDGIKRVKFARSLSLPTILACSARSLDVRDTLAALKQLRKENIGPTNEDHSRTLGLPRLLTSQIAALLEAPDHIIDSVNKGEIDIGKVNHYEITLERIRSDTSKNT